MTSNGSEMDISLISKLQRRIAALELEKKSLRMASSSSSSATTTTTSKLSLSSAAAHHHDNNNNQQPLLEDEGGLSLVERLQQDKDYELIKAQELELENQKLREDLNRLIWFNQKFF